MNVFRACCALALLGLTVPARAGEVRYLSTPEYFDALMTEIGRATSSVSVGLYLFNLVPNRSDSKPMQLAESLAAARGRWVRVEVVLDGSRDF